MSKEYVSAVREATSRSANAEDVADSPKMIWDDFEARLVDSLAGMAVDQYFILSTRAAGDEESLYYVQFLQGGRVGFRAEAVSNQFLMGAHQLSPAQEDVVASLGWQFPDPHATKGQNFSREWPMPAPFPEVARLAVRTLREVFGVAEPGDLVYKRFARGGHDFAEPSLGISSDRPTTPRGKGQTQAPTVAELKPLVEAALSAYLGVGSVVADASGNYPLRVGASEFLVRILPFEPPIVLVFGPVLRDVEVSPELLAAVNQANVEISFCRVLYVNSEVIVATDIRSAGITADDIAWACVLIGSWAERLRAQFLAQFPLSPADSLDNGPTLLN